MTDLVAAEWLKLRTTRLLVATLPTAVAVSMFAVVHVRVSKSGSRMRNPVSPNRSMRLPPGSNT